MSFPRKVLAACAVVTFGIIPQSTVLAQASGDGWQGPWVFNDAALNESLVAMNDFLQARYASDDIIASLHEPPQERDFATVAVAVGNAPALDSLRIGTGFGPSVADGRSLDLHLASFNTDLDRRGEELFVRVARAAGGTGLDFAEVAGVPPVLGNELAFGPEIWSDVTLDEHMLALFDHLIEQGSRNAMLSIVERSADTGSSFDRYGEALKLF